MEVELLRKLGVSLPLSTIPKWSGIANPSLYGISTHADFVNPRQRIVLLCLIKVLREEFGRLSESEPLETARFVIAMLSGLIDQLVDWNCRLSMWIPQNEQVGRAFCGPGIPMLWDYAETDPVLLGPANLWSKLKRIVEGTRSMGRFESVPHVFHAHAQSLPFEDEFFDAIVTDPPYYDNIFYSLLADFFFSWKRMLLNCIDADLFEQPATDSSAELVASTFRSGSPESAHDDYCSQLGLAISEAGRVLKENAVFSLVYSHSSLNGWEALIRAYRPTNLQISNVLPLKVERAARPRAMSNAAAINTCVTFVARKVREQKKAIDLNQLCDQFRRTARTLEVQFEKVWPDDDISIALFGQGVALLANVSSVSDCKSVRESLLAIEKIVQERYPNFAVQKRRSL
jgi:putative DNA methylase